MRKEVKKEINIFIRKLCPGLEYMVKEKELSQAACDILQEEFCKICHKTETKDDKED
jgi:hypothetical protein